MEFRPVFKEKGKDQFYFDNNEWYRCDESKIMSLWHEWLIMPGARTIIDDEGFTVFGVSN